MTHTKDYLSMGNLQRDQEMSPWGGGGGVNSNIKYLFHVYGYGATWPQNVALEGGDGD